MLLEKSTNRCKDCLWANSQTTAWQCLRQSGKGLDPHWPACVLYEKKLDCLSCGACCRKFYQIVPVSLRDSTIHIHPTMVEPDRHTFKMKRNLQNQHCIALTQNSHLDFTCSIYHNRPRTCRDLAIGSDACLLARQKAGLVI